MFVGQNKNKVGVWFGLFCIFFSGALHAKILDFSGSWSHYEDRCSYEFSDNFDFVQKGNKVIGTYSGGTTRPEGGMMGKLRGVVNGNKLFIRVCSDKSVEPSINNPTCPKYGKRYDAYFIKKGKNTLLKYESFGNGKRFWFEKSWYSLHRVGKKDNIPDVPKKCS